MTYAPLLSEDGKLRNIVLSVRDITHFRTAEEIKSTFISIISHELRTPVTLIKGYASTLRRDDAKWDRTVVSDSLAVIEEEADRLAHMIDDLLDASRLQAGGISLNRADVSLPALAKRVAERFAPQSQKHTILTDFPAKFPVILGDETRLDQVLVNLVSNSLKYAPGGEIKISGSVRPEQVIVCVSDEGPGIDARDLPHIFDRFYRSTTRPNKPKAQAWAYIWRAQSSKPMGAAFGQSQRPIPVRGYVSRCRVRRAIQQISKRLPLGRSARRCQMQLLLCFSAGVQSGQW